MAFFEESVFFGVVLSLLAYGAGTLIQRKWKLAILNPLLIAVVIVIVFLVVCHIDYGTYERGAQYISYLLTPATVSLVSITVLAALFHFSRSEWITFLPKSVTTAIGMGISEELGGYASITAAVIILSGIFGNICAGWTCRLFHITDLIAKGVGIGSASHAIGTTKAMEMGEAEGAMSSLSLVVSGVLTVIGAAVIVQIL